MEHYFCSTCDEILSEGDHRPIRHQYCGQTLCALCWIKMAKKNKPCLQCKKKLYAKELILMIFNPTSSGIVLKQQYGDKNYIMMKQELLNYRIKRQNMIPLGCRKHKQKNILYDLLKGVFYCSGCKINLEYNSHINVEELYDSTFYTLMTTAKKANEIFSKINRYFKDKIYDTNQIIINIYYNITFEKLISVLEFEVDSCTLSKIKIVLGKAFEFYNKINIEVYETLSIFKDKLINFLEKSYQDLEEFEKVFYSDLEFHNKEQFNFHLKSQCELPLDVIIDSVYADNKKLHIIGKEISINIRNTIFGLLSQNIDDSLICQNAIDVLKDNQVTIKTGHYEWIWPL